MRSATFLAAAVFSKCWAGKKQPDAPDQQESV
jgi:hypothetical protein